MNRSMKNNNPAHLSDADLVAEVKRLARCERETTMRLIIHLAEFDARGLYLAAGFSSLFSYCTEVLRLSEQEAYNRIQAARAARKYPIIFDLLGEAALNLPTVRLLAPHLTSDNHQELLTAARGRSKRGVEELLARRFPQPAVPSSVRKLPAAKTIAPTPAAPNVVGAAETSTPSFAFAAPVSPAPSVASTASAPVAPPPPPARRPLVAPLAPDRYQVRFTASAQTCEKLRLAQDLLRHAVPNGDVAEIVDRALTALLESLARKKFAETKRPRASRSTSPSVRHIPAEVKRAVRLRDGNCCAFVGTDGRRCSARAFLEFHHVKPFGVGGEATVENIQLRCGPHNRYEADLYYGASRPKGGEDVLREHGGYYLGLSSTRSGASSGKPEDGSSRTGHRAWMT
jgi:hypothetical protein